MIHSFSRIERLVGTTDLLVSLNQEKRLLFEETFYRHNTRPSQEYLPFNLVLVLRVNGPLEVRLVENALNAIVRRHAALRVAFYPAGNVLPFEREVQIAVCRQNGVVPVGFYRQSIANSTEASCTFLDLADLRGWELDRGMEMAVYQAAGHTFDYSNPPLLRSVVVKLAKYVYSVIVVLSHLVADDWSLHILEREFAALYSHGERTLPELPVSYVDFATWQRKNLAGSLSFSDDVSYWRRQWDIFAADQIDSGQLPYAGTVRGRKPLITRCEHFQLNLTRNHLNEVAMKNGATLYMLLLAAFSIQIYRYTRQKRIGIWSKFANRVQPNTPAMVGWFVNSHLIGLSIADEMRVSGFLQEVRVVVLDAIRHQEIPFPLLANALRVQANATTSRVFFDFVSAHAPRHRMQAVDGNDHLRINRAIVPGYAKLGNAFEIRVFDHKGGITLSARYPSCRFERRAIVWILKDLQLSICRLVEGLDTGMTVSAIKFPDRYKTDDCHD